MSHPDGPVMTPDLTLERELYGRYMRALEIVGGPSQVQVAVADDHAAMAQGDIFLFNHFTRFEVVVPPYVLFSKTGALVRSVADHALFDVNDTLSRHLRQMGAVPNNLPRLLPFLAEEVLRGRKVVIFPEGGMIKDKNVMDSRGRYQMFSPSKKTLRPHHRGAAVLALMVELTKRRLRQLLELEDEAGLAQWSLQLQMDVEGLRAAAYKPTLVVPGNITFYPIRTQDNLLVRGLGRFMGEVQRVMDELTIESNLLLRPTDMDVRFGAPIPALNGAHAVRDQVWDQVLAYARSVDDVFELAQGGKSFERHHSKVLIEREVERIREEYSHRIYRETTVNVNHVAANLMSLMLERGEMEMPVERFHKVLYLTARAMQAERRLHLHKSVGMPEQTLALLDGSSQGLKEFMHACGKAKLVKRYGAVYRLSHRLQDEHGFHEIRLENTVRMHTNETAPLPYVRQAVEQALLRVDGLSSIELAELQFDDVQREHTVQKQKYAAKGHVVMQPNDPHFGAPYMLLPKMASDLGVLLVHGFATTPEELKPFAEQLRADGHVVMGVRLSGHATCPADMEARSRADWLQDVQRGLDLLRPYCQRVVIIGFSTGGALALSVASTNPERVSAVVSVSAPVVVSDRNMRVLPLIIAFRKLLGWVPGLRHALRWYGYGDGAGDVYDRVPVVGIYELRRLIGEMVNRLPKVVLPVLVLQGTADKTLHRDSAHTIFDNLGSEQKSIRWLEGGPHGLISQNYGQTWDILRDYVKSFSRHEERKE